MILEETFTLENGVQMSDRSIKKSIGILSK